jgi:hypothetical protein
MKAKEAKSNKAYVIAFLLVVAYIISNQLTTFGASDAEEENRNALFNIKKIPNQHSSSLHAEAPIVINESK